MKRLLLTMSLLIAASVSALQGGSSEKVWVQTSYEDFRRGHLPDGGNNLYVSRNGSIQTVHRWDLNQDGYVDLIFNNSHDEWQTIPAYLFVNRKGKGFDPSDRLELPADGAYKAAIRDLNRDGYPEIVLANTFNGTTMKLHAYIYWGSASGHSAARRTELPTVGARQIAIGDFNKDGHLDLAFAQQGDVADNPNARYGSVENRTSYVYWGDAEGYAIHRRQFLETVAATDAVAADFDQDGYDDLVTLNNPVGEVEDLVLFRGSPEGLRRTDTFGGKKISFVRAGDVNADNRTDLVVGYTKDEVVRVYLAGSQGLKTEGAGLTLQVSQSHDAEVADINRDGKPDLVVAAGGPGQGTSYIYYGSNEGFSEAKRQALPTLGASACTVADLNSDGHQDVIFANAVDEESHSVRSDVYWNSASGFSVENRTGLPTVGANDVVAADVNDDETIDLLFVGRMGGRRKADIYAYVYMSDRNGNYSQHNRLELPTVYGYESSAADLNGDRYPDLIMANLASRDPSQNRGSYIYWGGDDGHSVLRRTALDTDDGGWASSVADLNRDGYLDILFTQIKSGVNKIYYGAPQGPGHELLKTFRDPDAIKARTPAIADLNKDGYLDLIIPYIHVPWVSIFWGHAGDYSSEHMTRLPGNATVSVEVADLNRDGWLDLVLCNFWDLETLSHQTNSYIYWGSERGFSANRRQELPTSGAHDASVGDVNGDGYLDIAISNYHRGQIRHGIASYIYLGSREGYFRRENRVELVNDSAAGNLVADLNHDGYLDVVFSNHTLWGIHHAARSRIFWGGPDTFTNTRVSYLPTIGPHQMTSTDIGNIYTRKLEEYFESEPFQTDAKGRFTRIGWDAELPPGSSVKFQVRTAAARSELKSQPWQGWTGKGTYYEVNGERLRGLPSDHRWIQYRAVLGSDFGAGWPIVNEVRIYYEP